MLSAVSELISSVYFAAATAGAAPRREMSAADPNLAPKRADWLELPGRSGAPPYVIDTDGIKRWG